MCVHGCVCVPKRAGEEEEQTETAGQQGADDGRPLHCHSLSCPLSTSITEGGGCGGVRPSVGRTDVEKDGHVDGLSSPQPLLLEAEALDPVIDNPR